MSTGFDVDINDVVVEFHRDMRDTDPHLGRIREDGVAGAHNDMVRYMGSPHGVDGDLFYSPHSFC